MPQQGRRALRRFFDLKAAVTMLSHLNFLYVLTTVFPPPQIDFFLLFYRTWLYCLFIQLVRLALPISERPTYSYSLPI